MAHFCEGAAPRWGVALKRPLLIVGAGGHGRSVAEVVLAAGEFELAGFVDDAAPGLSIVWNLAVLGTTTDVGHYRVHADHAIVAMGNNAVRESLCSSLLAAGFELATIVHPLAIVSPRAVIGQGCTIMAGAVVGTEARLGCGVIVNCGAVVDHNAQVHDYAHLAVNAVSVRASHIETIHVIRHRPHEGDRGDDESFIDSKAPSATRVQRTFQGFGAGAMSRAGRIAFRRSLATRYPPEHGATLDAGGSATFGTD